MSISRCSLCFQVPVRGNFALASFHLQKVKDLKLLLYISIKIFDKYFRTLVIVKHSIDCRVPLIMTYTSIWRLHIDEDILIRITIAINEIMK